jgi:hypothetical protein
MQARRRENLDDQQAAWPESAHEMWERLETRDPEEVCRCAGATREGDLYVLNCLGETWTVHPVAREVTRTHGTFGGEWDRQVPFLILLWLALAGESAATGEMVHPRDLVPGRDPFEGRHSLDTADLEKTFGEDAPSFLDAARALGGEPDDQADGSVLLRIFPKIGVQYLLWVADEEFPARVSILVEKGAPLHYPADGLATIINLLSRRLIFVYREKQR